MSLINCKLELKLKWTKYCILTAASADNADANSNNFIFSIKDTKLYVSVNTLSAKINQRLSKFLMKRVQRSVYWNEYKTKNENKNMTQEYRYYLKLIFINSINLF